jgi:hypothetical protein
MVLAKPGLITRITRIYLDLSEWSNEITARGRHQMFCRRHTNRVQRA